MNLVARAGRAVLDTLLPPHCLACDAPVAQDGQFCLPCFRAANLISAPFCARCGVPLPFGDATGLCTACHNTPPLFRAARAALRYDDMTKRLILPFKYADRPELARGIAVLMARAGSTLLARADVLLPVPLHRARLRQRGYNQSVLLAAELARATNRPLLRDVLIRAKPTIPLGGLGLAARQAALADAIAIHPDRAALIQRKTALLIDDVMTSGATANACAAVLLAAGAAHVEILTAARVADPRYE